MELYLHIGIYKTGSSFLQTMCGRNRSLLQQYGYYFPTSEREADLMAGRISPGNAQGLVAFLKQGDVAKTTALLERWTQEAEAISCDKILISAEALIHPLATAVGTQPLVQAVQTLGIELVKCLGFFRDPLDHCLSTYKHRAKGGAIADFPEWVEQHYETMEVLNQFHGVYRQFPITWSFRKYNQDGEVMARAFFSDWLGIDTPALSESKEINVSLNLSELLTIQQLASANPDWIPHISHAFMGIPRDAKANDRDLEKVYLLIIGEKLQHYNGFIHAWNQLMPPLEKLSGFAAAPGADSVIREEVTLSKAQLRALAEGIQKANRLWAIGKSKLRKVYRQWKRAKS